MGSRRQQQQKPPFGIKFRIKGSTQKSRAEYFKTICQLLLYCYNGGTRRTILAKRETAQTMCESIGIVFGFRHLVFVLPHSKCYYVIQLFKIIPS